MKPESNNRHHQARGATDAVSFGISEADSAHIMGILREGLYTDRVLAVLREYSANGWDAHRMAGKGDLPIEIHVPVEGEPVFSVRDHGPGLSRAEMFQIFTQYGSSTKRGSNEAVGMLGIGSKSAFAYADTFTVISRHGGRCCTYVAALDESEKGTLSLLDERACSPDDTGIEIRVATKPDDQAEWERKARRLYKHMHPRPRTNIELPALPTEATRLTNGTIVNDDRGRWLAIMGCVPYAVDLDHLDNAQLPQCLREMSGSINFAIGDVAVSASREELKYTPATKRALAAKLVALIDEYVEHAFAALEAGSITGWEARLRVRVLAKLDLPLPEQWREYGSAYAKLEYTEKSGFTLLHNGGVTTRITVDADATLWLDDAGRDLKGYGLGVDDYVVRPRGNKTADEIERLLTAALAASQLTGLKIERLSTRYWAEHRVPKKRQANPKHRSRMFTFTSSPSYCAPYSDYWEPVSRVPEDDDVWVAITAFKPNDERHWFSQYQAASRLAQLLGEEMPTVYGYKHTEARPVDATATKGRSWAVWLRQLLDRATAIVKPRLGEAQHWADLNDTWQTPYRAFFRTGPTNRDALADLLGTDHPIVRCITRHLVAVEAQRDIAQMTYALSALGCDPVDAALSWDRSEAKREIDAALAPYALLRERDYLDNLLRYDSRRNAWAEYVRLVDAAAASPATLKTTDFFPTD